MSETRKEPAKHALYVTEEQVGALRKLMESVDCGSCWRALTALSDLEAPVRDLYRSIHGPEE